MAQQTPQTQNVRRKFLFISIVVAAVLLYLIARGGTEWVSERIQIVKTTYASNDKTHAILDTLSPLPTTHKAPTNEVPTTAAPKLQLIIPSFEGHFYQLLHLLKSLTCLCIDIHTLPISIILSNQEEITHLQKFLAQVPPCGDDYQQYDTRAVANLSAPPLLELVNFYDILPDSIRSMTSHDTTDLLHSFEPNGKYKYQTMKKIAAAAYYDYDYGVWLDSEGFALRPFNMTTIVSTYMEHPVIFRSIMNNERLNGDMIDIMECDANILGRTMDSFGQRYWNLESFLWIIEKPIIEDMINLPSLIEPDKDFWSRLVVAKTKNFGPFEGPLYFLHVHAMKEESEDPLYTKYRVLDVERELKKTGLGNATHQVSDRHGTGILERLVLMLLEGPETIPPMVEFIKKYRQYFQRMDDKLFLEKEELLEFLRNSSIAMITSSEPGFDEWVAEDQVNGAWTMTYA